MDTAATIMILVTAFAAGYFAVRPLANRYFGISKDR